MPLPRRAFITISAILVALPSVAGTAEPTQGDILLALKLDFERTRAAMIERLGPQGATVAPELVSAQKKACVADNASANAYRCTVDITINSYFTGKKANTLDFLLTFNEGNWKILPAR